MFETNKALRARCARLERLCIVLEEECDRLSQELLDTRRQLINPMRTAQERQELAVDAARAIRVAKGKKAAGGDEYFNKHKADHWTIGDSLAATEEFNRTRDDAPDTSLEGE